MRIPRYLFYGTFLLIVLILLFMYLNAKSDTSDIMKEMQKSNRYIDELRLLTGIGTLSSAHIHADIAIFVEGTKMDLSKPQYQLRASSVHLEEDNGEVIHVHADGITIGNFLNSIGMHITAECLTLDNGKELCSKDDKTLKFFVNGEENEDYGSYVIRDIDKILISYGNEPFPSVEKQLKAVTDLAKTKSGKSMALG